MGKAGETKQGGLLQRNSISQAWQGFNESGEDGDGGGGGNTRKNAALTLDPMK